MKISIVSPILNGGKYLREAIDSIKSQEGDWEYLLIDDASTDDGEEIAKSYNDKRIRWIKADLANVHKKMNLGMFLMTGDLFVTIGSDDWFLPSAFKRAREEIKEANWLVGHSKFIDISNKEKPERIAPAFRTCFKDILTQSPLPTTSMFVRTDFIRKHGIKWREDLEVSSDIDLQIQILFHDSNGVFLLEDYLTCIRDHPGTMTNTKREIQQAEAFRIKEEWKNKCVA